MSDNVFPLSFVPGELLLVVEHNNTDSLKELCANVIRYLHQNISNTSEELGCQTNLKNLQQLLSEINNKSPSVITFGSGESDEKYESYIRINFLEGNLDSDKEIIDGQTIIMSLIANGDVHENLLNQSGIKSVSPNWLAAGSQDLTTVGGPGKPAKPNKPKVKKMKPKIRNAHNDPINAPDDKPTDAHDVHVFVLDTIPKCNDEYEEAIDCFLKKEKKKQQKNQQTINYYTNLKAKLDIAPPDPLVSQHSNIDTAKHSGPKTDHGLFIAGLIHDIVPYVPINLIQVLNDNGVGTLFSLASGVREVLGKIQKIKRDYPQNKNFVVNMSLTFAIPRINSIRHMPNLGNPKKNQTLYRLYSNFMKYVLCHEEMAAKSLKLLIDKLNPVIDPKVNNGTFVVAAAGNDGTSGTARPEALYPAAFENVIGVGALNDKQKKYADFSNHADNPHTAGLSTLGVDLIGPYLNSPTGFAAWSGTSFATGIVTGTLALLLARNVAEPLNRIEESVEDSSEDDGSNYIEVE